MKRKTLLLTLIAAGLVVAATSAAFSINPRNWFTKNTLTGSAASGGVVPTPSSVLPRVALEFQSFTQFKAWPACLSI
ncbi:MAG: hypothetical protein Q7T07_04590 [Burkholderiaceae bacterium]|nr:hypothetical protein [Burkholderiaceae bacterium]